MNRKAELREQIDSCRAGSDDLARDDLKLLAEQVASNPQVALELAHSQEFDQRIRVALADVSVPTDLAQRLLAAVEEANSTAGVDGTAAVVELPQARIAVQWRRRTWWTAVASVAAGIVLTLAGLWLWPRQPRLVEQQEIVQAVPGWQAAAGQQGTIVKALPGGVHLPPQLIAKPGRAVQFKTSQRWASKAVSVSLGGNATLYIVQSSARFRVPAVPFARIGYSKPAMAAWQSGHLLYVLVVEEAAGERLENYIRPTPIT